MKKNLIVSLLLSLVAVSSSFAQPCKVLILDSPADTDEKVTRMGFVVTQDPHEANLTVARRSSVRESSRLFNDGHVYTQYYALLDASGKEIDRVKDYSCFAANYGGQETGCQNLWISHEAQWNSVKRHTVRLLRKHKNFCE